MCILLNLYSNFQYIKLLRLSSRNIPLGSIRKKENKTLKHINLQTRDLKVTLGIWATNQILKALPH